MRRIYFAAALMMAAQPALATDFQANMQAYYDSGELAWINDASIVAAINVQNSETADFTEAQILELDQDWRGQVGTADTALVDAVLGNDVAEFLRSQVAASGGMITEVFVMDAQGLNVAASHTTSDYWQGDEAKHQDTFGVGPDAVHFSDIELDESTQSYQGQISVTIVDPATGTPIGAITIGVDAQALS